MTSWEPDGVNWVDEVWPDLRLNEGEKSREFRKKGKESRTGTGDMQVSADKFALALCNFIEAAHKELPY